MDQKPKQHTDCVVLAEKIEGKMKKSIWISKHCLVVAAFTFLDPERPGDVTSFMIFHWNLFLYIP